MFSSIGMKHGATKDNVDMGECTVKIEEGIDISYNDVKLEKELGVIDIIEQYMDEKEVNNDEKYEIKNEEFDPICTDNQPSASSTKEIPQVSDSESVNLELRKSESHTDGQECSQNEYDCSLESETKGLIKSPHSNIETQMSCGYTTSVKNLFDSVHLKIKKYTCRVCKYSTNEKRRIKNHIKSVHLNIKEYKCHLCEHSTSEKGKLQRHVDTVHLKVKKHECHLCDYAAFGKTTIRHHIKSVHLVIRDHKCHLCDFAASKKSNLEAHIKSVHLKIKEHKCHLCDYAGDTKNRLERHVKLVHLKLKDHKCNLCDYASAKKKDLENHMESVHFTI